MAEKKEKCSGEVCHISVEVAENGYNVTCCYEPEKSLGQRAGWYPCGPGESKKYVEKTPDAVAKRVKEILSEKHCSE